MFKFCKHQLWECSRTLSDVAMGRRPADTVIRDARLVNVCTHEILDHTDVAIACGRIALVGDAAHCIGPETEVIEAGGQLLAPGCLTARRASITTRTKSATCSGSKAST